MSGIFVNYRQNFYPEVHTDRRERRAHGLIVEAIADRLALHFRSDSIFVDKEIRAASRYPNELRDRLKTSELVVALIHDEWLRDLKDRAHRYGTDATDWVRFELATAFAEGIHVLPVLIDTARLPSRDELVAEFGDIAELGVCQAYRIQAGHWRRDMNGLLAEAERYVATEPLPEQVHEEEAAQRWRWLWPLAASVVGLSGPYVVTVNLAASPPGPMPWLAASAGLLLLSHALVLGVMSVQYVARSLLDDLDHQAAIMAHDQRTNVIVGLTVGGLGTIFLISSEFFPPMLQASLLAVLVLMIITIGLKWLYDRRHAGQWPVPRLAADPAAIRGAISRVVRHLEQGAPMMTRLQRDQARFALDQIRQATARLDTRAKADRRGWLRARSTWLTTGQIASLGATVGAAGGALLAYWNGGGRHWSAPVALGGIAAAAVGCSLLIFDRGYRIQRWRKKVVVDAVPAELEKMDQRLTEISVQPARQSGSYMSHPPAVHDGGSRSSGDSGAGGVGLRDEDAPQGAWSAGRQD